MEGITMVTKTAEGIEIEECDNTRILAIRKRRLLSGDIQRIASLLGKLNRESSGNFIIDITELDELPEALSEQFRLMGKKFQFLEKNLHLCGVNDEMRRKILMSNLDKYVVTVPTREEALSAVST